MEERIIKDINNLLIQLFQKIKEAGYKWDSDKNELKKIEQKHTLSEYDKGFNDGYSAAEYNQWKPSEKQMKALKNTVVGTRGPLYELYFDLTKL